MTDDLFLENLTPNEIVAERVAIWLRRRSQPAVALADALGVTQATMSRKLKGLVTWSVTDLACASGFLGVPVEVLVPAEAIEKAKRPTLSGQAPEFIEPVPQVGLEPTTDGL